MTSAFSFNENTHPSLWRSASQRAPEFGFHRSNIVENMPPDASAGMKYINPGNLCNYNNHFRSNVGRGASAPIQNQLPSTTGAISSVM